MPRLRWLLALGSALSLTLCLAPACGGGGGDHGGGDDEGGDGGPVDGGGDRHDGAVGPGELVQGLFQVLEVHFGDDVYQWGSASGSIVDPRPRYHRIAQEAGACRMWTYGVGDCGACDGLCNADGDCVPWPVQLDAGQVTVDGTRPGDLVMRFETYGYFPPAAPASELFADGDPVSLAAAGGGDVPAFSLAAAGADAIALELEETQAGNGRDTLRLEDGGDLVVTWSPVAPGTRVRLELLANNRGHGLPVDAMIECEADDSGRIQVPRAMVEAFPEKPYQNACAGTDCPPSSLTRFRAGAAEVDGRRIELRVGAQRQFIVVHDVR